MRPTRRSLLAAGAAFLAGTAGCTGRRAGNRRTESTTGTPTTGTTGTATTTGTTEGTATTTDSTGTTARDPARYGFGDAGSVGGLSVTPTGARAQCSTFYLMTADQVGVVDPDGRRLLFVDVAVEGGGPDPSAFVLDASGDSYRGWTEYSGERAYSLAPDGRRGEAYRPDRPTGWVGFDLPVGVEAGRVELRLDREGSPVWTLPEAPTAALRAGEPAFEVRSVAVPDTVESVEAIPFSMTVANTGEGPGVFRFSINYRGPTWGPSPRRIDLDAGESRSLETEIEPYGGSGADSMTLAVTTATSDREYTVEEASDGEG